jgi:hypothetical protein
MSLDIASKSPIKKHRVLEIAEQKFQHIKEMIEAI